MKLLTIMLLALSFFNVSCSSGKKVYDQEHMVASTVWVQNAAEVRALQYQAFNIATQKLKTDLKWAKSDTPRAVVVDADETIIDNSPYQAKNILENKTYNSASWGEWVEEARATAIPGAVEFLNYADKNGVEIFYITNRKINGFNATYKNLKKLGFPVKKENMLLRTDTSSKVARRKVVTSKYRIVLLMGDNLDDFDDIFEKKSIEDRFSETDKLKKRFGSRYIVLPNPMYGTWEGAIYNYDYKKTDETKDKDRKKALKL